jgi:hypothetical protein
LVTAASLILTNKEVSASSSSAGEEFTVSKADAINDYSEDFSKGCMSTNGSGAPSPVLQDKPLVNSLPVQMKNVVKTEEQKVEEES